MAADGRLAGRIALITGASRGIGASIATRYAAEGAHVVLVGRTVGGLEEIDDAIQAAGGAATLVPQDLTDQDAIDRLGAALFERFGRLDILVGNAGSLGILSPVHHIEPKLWEETFAVNVTVNFRLIRALDPLLRQSESGRAIFVTTGATKAPRAYWSAYGASKIALEYMVQTWAAEVGKTALRVNLVNPGATRTAMRATAFPGEDPQTVKPPEALGDLFVDLGSADCTRHGEIVDA